MILFQYFSQRLIERIYYLDEGVKNIKKIKDENDQLKSEATILHNDSRAKSQEIKNLKLKVNFICMKSNF